jgi:micrococcal nuclease
MRVTRTITLACLAVLVAACQPTLSLPATTPAANPRPAAVAPTSTAAPTPTPAPTRQPTPQPTPELTQTPTPPPPATPSPTPTPSPTAAPTASPTAAPTASPTQRPTDPPPIGLAPSGPTQEARVVRVVDGDTIRVLLGGQEYPVRYIGIDTPETVHPSKPVEWMGREASEANKRLVDGQIVVLEKDVSETDRYGRLLRYIWLQEGGAWLLVNLELVRLGLAQVSTYPPDVKYTELYLEAQREAREAGAGLWGDASDAPEGGGEGNGGTSGPGGGDSCDPAYPTVCIPPSPPDLDCGDITEGRFTVLPPDPHRFDGDGDGIGCEGG